MHHVTLLIALRFVAIIWPMTFRNFHDKIKDASIIIIWVLSCLLHIVKCGVFTNDLEHGRVLNLVFVFTFNVIPVISIIAMNLMIILHLRRRKTSPHLKFKHKLKENEQEIEDKMISVVQKIVIVMIVCYGPYLGWRLYYSLVIDLRSNDSPTFAEVIIS